MQKKWSPQIIENLQADNMTYERYQMILEEVAAMIYSDLCQLSTTNFSDSSLDEDNFLQRTGTDA